MKNKDIYIQEDACSCGACCIESIISYYGGYIPLESVYEDTNTDRSGTNAYELVLALKKYGFEAYGLKVSLMKIDKNKLPLIAHTIKNGYEHFLVVYDIDSENVLTMDPEVGKMCYTIEDFEKIFTEEVIIASPMGEIVRYKKSNSIIKSFSPFLKRTRGKLIFVILLSGILLTLSLLISYNIKLLSLSDSPLLITIILLVLQLVVTSLQYVKECTLLNTLKFIDEETISMFVTHIFKLPIRYLKNKRVGEIVKKIEDMSSIKDFFLRAIVINQIDILTILVCFILMFSISSYLSLVNILFTISYFVFSCISLKGMYKEEKNVLRLYNTYAGNLVEYIEGIESIKNLNEEDNYLGKVDRAFKNYSYKALDKNKSYAKIELIKSTVLNAGVIIGNLVGYLSIGDEFTLFDLISYTSICSLMYNSIESLLETFSMYLKSKAVYRSVCEFNDVKEESTELDYTKPFESLTVENLSFSYDRFNKVLDRVSLEIKKGEKIYVRGPSGVGKSTFVKALCGRLKNYEGKIFLNGTDIAEISPVAQRNYCMYVGQEEKLFTGTIIENIVGVEPNKEWFDQVSQLTMLDELLAKRREGENTSLLEGATNISGGERARIILARALYKKPSLLIIDETLSSVSLKMEDQILKNLLSRQDLTLIYISHRNKEKMFDKVIELEGNKYEIN